MEEVIINHGYKFKILPAEKPKEFLLKSFGCARKMYNLYVNELYRNLEDIDYKNGFIDRKALNLTTYGDFKKSMII